VLAKLKQLREQFAAKAEMERRRRQAQDNWEQSDTYKRQYPQGQADGGRVPSLDEMRLAITKAKGGLAKFLEPSKVKSRLYHSTSSDFKEFDPSMDVRGNNMSFVSDEPYYHPDKDHTTMMPLYAQVKKVFDASKLIPKQTVEWIHTNADLIHKELSNYNDDFGLAHHAHEYFDKDEPLNPKKYIKHLKSGDWQAVEAVPSLVKHIRSLGHDAIKFYEEGSNTYGVFDPRNIKSAIGNRGTYDPNDPDITKAKGGSVEPKSTVKAYKLFRVHPDHPGKLFPLFVDANTPVEMNKWVDAKEGEMANGKVKSKIGALAYRPGWHAGDLPIATHIGEKSDPKLTAPDRRPANHAWAEVEMPNDVDWQAEANKRGTNAQGRVVPVKAHITDQIPKGGHYRYKTNPNMTGNWLIGGSMKVNKVLTDAEVARINKAAGISDLPRAEPFKKKAFGFAHGGVTHAHHLEIEERPL
jgi:hypothetical protein